MKFCLVITSVTVILQSKYKQKKMNRKTDTLCLHWEEGG